ncbi:glycosyltransferase [Nocardioides sp. InS609-2]|uniref:glycosyltransferase n=1 Tax=Nocardioides sp. InS609-2 TaxID=2760705 RepID=UPI0020BECA74|nr:glycosyltransferase [Nocardioides sp. InS609-2]
MSERVGWMMRRPRRVAWIYRSPDTSTFRYRVSNIVDALNNDPDCDIGAGWFSELELDSMHHLIERLDAVVIVRYPCSGPLLRLMDRARHCRVPLIFDSDDLVFDPKFAPFVMDAIGVDGEDFRNWSLWLAYMGQLQQTVSRCDAGLTTGVPLQERMAPYFDEGRVALIPNFLNRDQERYSRELLDAKRDSGWKRDGAVTVGYFSGTPTHARDFAVVSPALHRLLVDDPEVRLRVVGRLDVLGELADLPSERVDVMPFMDYVALQRAIAGVEVNLAPLQHHAFTACKSELKYFESAAVGSWTIASSTPAFTGAIADGRTGRVVRAHEWDDALRESVDLARDTAGYQQRAEESADEVYQRYGWDRQVQTIVEALTTTGLAEVGKGRR